MSSLDLPTEVPARARLHSTNQHHPNSTSEAIDLEDRFGTHNYHPLPVVLKKGRGSRVWDVAGLEYLDFLSAYSAVNQG
ncbi:MAG: aminotransferase class III-fold pyridoxal phosphate-dependent enzyme, partial [Bacteroidetes bacterium]|nr:aminotransferase class III-fold pyridoxal phosphate-dependent enzyme [Bacteroidota bacterium]